MADEFNQGRWGTNRGSMGAVVYLSLELDYTPGDMWHPPRRRKYWRTTLDAIGRPRSGQSSQRSTPLPFPVSFLPGAYAELHIQCPCSAH
jgi:hypothetical protein